MRINNQQITFLMNDLSHVVIFLIHIHQLPFLQIFYLRQYISKEFIPNDPYNETTYLANVELQTDSKGQNRIICYKDEK